MRIERRMVRISNGIVSNEISNSARWMADVLIAPVKKYLNTWDKLNKEHNNDVKYCFNTISYISVTETVKNVMKGNLHVVKHVVYTNIYK